MSNLIKHATNELKRIGMTVDSEDELNSAMTKDILQIVEIFAEQGHSGFSANYCTNMLDKLLRYEILEPLTGEDSEWSETGWDYANGAVWYQNLRSSNVFKECITNLETGEQNVNFFQSDRYIFREPDGGTYVGQGSLYKIESWPYMPEREYIDVPFSEEAAAINNDKQ